LDRINRIDRMGLKALEPFVLLILYILSSLPV